MTIIPAMTVEEAQRLRKCRFCTATILPPPGVGKDWLFRFDTIAAIRVMQGSDFAHEHCYKAWRESGGVELEISEKMGVVGTIGELRLLIEDLPDSLPVFLSQKGKYFTPVFAVEGRTEIIQRFGQKALEIRDG